MSQFAAIQAMAPSLSVEVVPVNMRDAREIEQSVETFARSPNGGLIPTASAAAVRHRDLIVNLTTRYKLPSAYWERFFVDAGGLISYGPDLVDEFRQAASYVDRILRGEKPADLRSRSWQYPVGMARITLAVATLALLALPLWRNRPASGGYSSISPNVLPLPRSTKCTWLHARHVTDS